MSDFDFDEWCALAKRDPQAFFDARQREVEALICSAPQSLQGKLWDLQRCIDCERVRAGTPMRALKCLAVMMQERLEALDQQNRELRVLSTRLQDIAAAHFRLHG